MRNNSSRALVIDDAFSTPNLPRLATSLAHGIGNIDRQLRREGQTVPSAEIKQHLASRFWAFVETAAQVEALAGVDVALRTQCRNILAPWLWRSRFFNRSYHKPHGYAGDFRMIEWIYDLEPIAATIPHSPASSTAWTTCIRPSTPWSACSSGGAGSRACCTPSANAWAASCACSTSPAAARATSATSSSRAATSRASTSRWSIRDAAALAFCRTRSLVPWLASARIETRCRCSIVKLANHLRDRQFDVIISAGLFDYLSDTVARHVLSHMAALLAPGGIVAFSNFHTSDPSRVVKDWLVDWPLIYRDDNECAALLPPTLAIATERPDNRALCYATGRAT